MIYRQVVIRMRIDTFNKVSQLYQNNSAKSKPNVRSTGHLDKLEISQVAKDYQAAKKIVSNTPDVRKELVDDIKERMASGTYNVSARELADKLVDSYFDELI
jgi:negative regulator of flagellin synthesis FlgM